jgi:hypothetical protein
MRPFNIPKVHALRRTQTGRPETTMLAPIQHLNKWPTAAKLLVKYKNIDEALEALYAKDQKLRRDSRQKKKWFSRNQWGHADLSLDFDLLVSDTVLFSKQQRGLLFQAACDRKTGIQKSIASYRSRSHTAQLAVGIRMRPFHRQVIFLSWLRQLLQYSPHQSLQHFSSRFELLFLEMRFLADDLERVQVYNNSPNSYEKHHEIAKYNASRVCHQLLSASHILFVLTIHGVNSPSSDPRIREISTKTVRHSVSFDRCLKVISQDLIAVELRRHGSKAGHQQNVFTSLHHHIKHFLNSSNAAMNTVYRMYTNLCYAAAMQRKSMYKSASALAHSQPFELILLAAESTTKAMNRLYYDEFLPYWSWHIDFMSPSELKRYNEIAQHHWLQQLRTGSAIQSREAELHLLHNHIARARGVTRSTTSNRWTSAKTRHMNSRDKEHHRKALEAIKRLEQLHPSRVPDVTHTLETVLGLNNNKLVRKFSHGSDDAQPLPYSSHGRKRKVHGEVV